MSRHLSPRIVAFLTIAAVAVGAGLFFRHWSVVAQPDAFGLWHDDSILFATAQSLASGEGYRLPSWPGGMAQTKYPPAYPAALALVLLGSGDFPQSLPPAYALGAAFGVLFIAGCWMWLRGLGISATRSTLLTAVCAAHPTVALLSGSLLSDVPFAALMIWCAAAADRGVSGSRRKTFWWWLAALCAALAILTRSLGLALPLGMAVVAWRRRLGWREWAAFSLPAAAFVGWTAWTAVAGEKPADPTSGYGQLVVFYSSYLRFWALSVNDWPSFWRMIPPNAMLYLREPALLTLQIPQLSSSALGSGFSCLVSAGILVGIVRRLVTGRASVLHWAWIPYSGAVLLWNYPQMWRFLLPLLPLFLLTLAEQIERLVSLCSRTLASRDPAARWLARGYLVGFALLAIFVAYGYLVAQPSRSRALVEARLNLIASKREAYDWVRRSTSAEARFIAYDDVLLYLYTGRAAARPMAQPTRLHYDANHPDWEAQFARLTDVAEHLDADYWLTSLDDFGVEPPEPGRRLAEKQQNLFSSAQPVFRSSDGSVRVYRARF